MDNHALYLSSVHFIAYLNCRSKGSSLPWYTINNSITSMPNHTFMADKLFYDMFSPDSFHTAAAIEVAVPPHLAIRSNTNETDINNRNKDENIHEYIKDYKS